MKDILEILDILKSKSKKTEKKEVLRNIPEHLVKTFQSVVIATLGGDEYGVKKYPEPAKYTGVISLNEAVKSLRLCAERVLTGKIAINHIAITKSRLNERDAEVFGRIVAGNLKCGVSDGLINEVWNELIYIHPYMQCSPFSRDSLKKIRFPCYSQTKEDGQYVDVIVDDAGNVVYKSRKGIEQPKYNNPNFDSFFSKYKSNVFMGEVLVLDEELKEILPRKEGNGYLNRGDIDFNRLVIVVWDMVSKREHEARKGNVKYVHRYGTLKNIIVAENNSKIRLVDTVVCNSVQDIIDHFKANLLKGLEGTVVKNLDGLWGDYMSPDQVKCKIIFDVELKVVGVNLGEAGKKYENCVGAFVCESSDGLVKVDVGSGITDEQRQTMLDAEGLILTVRANDLIQDRNRPDVWSLFLPRMVEVRKDKTEADSYDKIVKQRDAFVELLNEIK